MCCATRFTSSETRARWRPTCIGRAALGRFPACSSSMAEHGGWARGPIWPRLRTDWPSTDTSPWRSTTGSRRQYKFPAQIHDCQAAVRWMRSHASEFKIDPARIGGFGYSAGGHLVALLGTLDDDELREPGIPANAPSARLQRRCRGRCAVRLSSSSRRQRANRVLARRHTATKPDEYRDASPASFITADDPPMFFFHGQQDMLVPVESPHRMVKLLKGARRDGGNVRREGRRPHSGAVRSRCAGAWPGICGSSI